MLLSCGTYDAVGRGLNPLGGRNARNTFRDVALQNDKPSAARISCVLTKTHDHPGFGIIKTSNARSCNRQEMHSSTAQEWPNSEPLTIGAPKPKKLRASPKVTTIPSPPRRPLFWLLRMDPRVWIQQLAQPAQPLCVSGWSTKKIKLVGDWTNATLGLITLELNHDRSFSPPRLSARPV